jgi:hypothetical protein
VALPFAGWAQSLLVENVANGLVGKAVSQVDQRAQEPVVTPGRVFPRQADDQLPHLGRDGRSARPPATPIGIVPFFGDELVMPFQERGGLNEGDDLRQQFAQRLAFFGQGDAFGVIQSPVRRVPFQQGAIDPVFFEDEFKFLVQGRFDPARNASQYFPPRHERAWLNRTGQARNYFVEFVRRFGFVLEFNPKLMAREKQTAPSVPYAIVTAYGYQTTGNIRGDLIAVTNSYAGTGHSEHLNTSTFAKATVDKTTARVGSWIFKAGEIFTTLAPKVFGVWYRTLTAWLGGYHMAKKRRTQPIFPSPK